MSCDSRLHEMESLEAREAVDLPVDPLRRLAPSSSPNRCETRKLTSSSGMTPEPTGCHQCCRAYRVKRCATLLDPRRRRA